MKLKLNTDRDFLAAAQVASLQSYRSIASLIGSFAHERCPKNENFVVTINKKHLPSSYRSNPAALAARALEFTTSAFTDCAGYQTPGKDTHVTIRLLRERKPDYARRTHANPTVKQIIKEWLALSEDDEPVASLQFEIKDIPPFFQTHPEQLTYQTKNETKQRIKITRNLTTWSITKK